MNWGFGVSPKDRTIQSYIIIYICIDIQQDTHELGHATGDVCIYIYIIFLHQNIL